MKRIFFVMVSTLWVSLGADEIREYCSGPMIRVANKTDTPVHVEINAGNQKVAQFDLAKQSEGEVRGDAKACSITDMYVYRKKDNKLLNHAATSQQFLNRQRFVPLHTENRFYLVEAHWENVTERNFVGTITEDKDNGIFNVHIERVSP